MLQALFSVDLPPGGKLPAGHRPVCNQTTIATLKDEVIIMNSLQKPKKITFIGRWGGGRHTQRICTHTNDTVTPGHEQKLAGTQQTTQQRFVGLHSCHN